jgi:hypothetical protein
MTLAYVTGPAEKQIIPTSDSIADRKIIRDVMLDPDVVAIYNKGQLQCFVVWPAHLGTPAFA